MTLAQKLYRRKMSISNRLRVSMVFVGVLLVAQFQRGWAICPYNCNGHGTCTPYNTCQCQEDYFGHDCGLRKCAVGRAWGIVRGVDAAHGIEECSGRGICIYELGLCRCQQGFSGAACEFVDCPDKCLGHGKCITMRENAQNQVIARELYDRFDLVYNNVWDADILQGCRCDAEFFGPNCGQKRCPVGDDPLTTGQVNEVQLIQCATSYTEQTVTLQSDAPLTTGTFVLFVGSQYTRPISFKALALLDSFGTSVANSLIALTGVPAVTATRLDPTPTTTTWQITFPGSNPTQNALSPRWKVIEVQQFICAADMGTFSFTFGNSTVRGVPYNSDINTFRNALATVPFVDTIDISLSSGVSICSAVGTTVTLKFTALWHRAFVGDLPPMTFSNVDAKGVTTLFLGGGLVPADGFIDTEAKEVIKGLDTCRVVEVQQITCAATTGNFALTFEDGTKLSDIPYTITAAQLQARILTVSYIKDVDVTFSTVTAATDPPAPACSNTGNVITIAFVVVKTTGARGDGDLAEVLADKTNGGVNGLNHISNRLQLNAAFTEVSKGATCVPLDQPWTGTGRQMVAAVTTGGGVFTVSFRGATSAPIRAHGSAAHVKRLLEQMPTIQGVDVSYSGAQACSLPANIISITFTQNFGNLPTIVADGSGLVPGSSITVAGAGNVINAIVSVDGTKESDVCSHRGLCDETKLGRCYCYLGYTNSDGRGGIGNILANRGDCGSTSRIPVSCPGDLACSGHGTCSGAPTYRCTCAKGWQGGDCSERQCPTGLAWFDYPAASNIAHKTMAECSGVGSCDRSNGNCKCPRPYTGSACELMLCGGDASECSGNGQCMTLNILAPQISVKGELMSFSYGDDPNNPLTWDRHKIRSCLCDPTYWGYDCSLRECPRGDDPSTFNDVADRQLVQCIANGGSFTLTFRDATTANIPFDATGATVEAALEAMGTILDATVVFISGATACSPTNTLIQIDLTSELGDLPSIKGSRALLRDSVNGNGQDGSGTLLFASQGDSLLGQASIKGTRENAYCSNHGKCNFLTGVCACDNQYGSSDGRGGPGPIGDCGYHYVRQVVANE